MSHRSRAGSPSIRCPASREMISDSVELWENWCLFLAHTNWLEQMFCFQKYTIHFLRLTLNPQGRLQSLILEITQVCSAVPCSPHDNIDDSHLCDEYSNSTLFVVYHMLESIVWLILPKFVHGPQDVRSSDSCQVQAFQDNLWANFWQFSDWFKFFLLELMVWSCSTFLCAIRSIAQRIFEHVLPCRRTTPRFVREFFCHPGNFSVAHAEIRDSNILYCSMMASFGSHARWVHPKYTWSRNDVGSSYISTFFHQSLSHWSQILLLSSNPSVIHIYWLKQALFTMNEHTFPVRNFLPSSF